MSLLNVQKRDEKGRNIQVVARCRPFNNYERKISHGVVDCDQTRKEVTVRTGGLNDKAARKTYTFDMVFGPSAKQIDVYRSVVCPILDEVIMGYNCTVFAYGQTGTGKTFTMEGERSSDGQFTWEEDPLAGIIPRTLHQIFEKLSENGTEFSIKVSLLEIYNEELFDLLSPNEDVTERLQLFDDPRNKRGVIVKGLEEITVHNKDDVYHILERGAAKRRTASTLMNAYSSRSHSVFSVTIHMKEITLDGEEMVKIGKLNLVDLAGSENIGRSGAVDKRAREAGNINQSLLTLGRVITALVEKRPHIPYRESKLTRILQDSLGGRTKTSIIATVSPSSSNMEESMSTLEYASRAKNIMNKPEVNQKLTKRTLIKEYTEEIERLKRDLAATRDKNGVYLSTENYESMSVQLSSKEEQIAEYTERIAVMEEEIKKTTELFTDHQIKLEQCTADLDEKRQRLELTHQDLLETKEKLNMEELISTELSSTQENLYNTAHQLLSTVDASTSDVSSLHAKLDRKTQVEEHNSQIKQSFVHRMDGALGAMQSCIQQQGTKHCSMVGSYTKALDGVVARNEAAMSSALVTVESFVGGVRALVTDSTARCQARVHQQEALSLEHKDTMVRLLEEHEREMKEVLEAEVVTALSALKELTDSLRTPVEAQQALAAKVEAMKDMGGVFRKVVQDLAELRETTVQEVATLQADHQRLEAAIARSQETHQTSMKQTIQCLEDQLRLIQINTQKDFEGLQAASAALRTPLQSVQQNIVTHCHTAETDTCAQVELLTSTSASLASSLLQNSRETQQALVDVTSHCSYLHTSLAGLGERDARWCTTTMGLLGSQAQEQVSLMKETSANIQALQQSAETCCTERLQQAGVSIAQQREETSRAVLPIQDQAAADRLALDEDQEELQGHVEASRGLVYLFVRDELQQDVPTGTTPQRRDFVYPRVLQKTLGRRELLESLRRQQEALHTALAQEEAMEEDEEEEQQQQVEHDSLDDNASTCNDSLATEASYVDENLFCSENSGVPFFKRKRAGKKEGKIPVKQSDISTEIIVTPQKSKLPLRCQNF